MKRAEALRIVLKKLERATELRDWAASRGSKICPEADDVDEEAMVLFDQVVCGAEATGTDESNLSERTTQPESNKFSE